MGKYIAERNENMIRSRTANPPVAIAIRNNGIHRVFDSCFDSVVGTSQLSVSPRGIQPISHLLGLEEEDGAVSEVEVDEVFRF